MKIEITRDQVAQIVVQSLEEEITHLKENLSYRERMIKQHGNNASFSEPIDVIKNAIKALEDTLNYYYNA